MRGTHFNISQIELAEASRLAAQQDFDQRTPRDTRNFRGQFATPPALAEAMVRLAEDLFPDIRPIRFLDPALGTGAFFSAILRIYGTRAVKSVLGFEVDRHLASIAKYLWTPFGARVMEGDFTLEDPPGTDSQKPNLVVCNPPYSRHHHLSATVKGRLKRRVAKSGFGMNGLAGLYAYFLFLAHEWLAPNGGAVWIIPAEFLDVNYGEAVKRYLRDEVTTSCIHRFDPRDVQFGDALVTSVILAFRKTRPSSDLLIALTAGGDLLRPSFRREIRRSQLDAARKWGPYFSEEHARAPFQLAHSGCTLGDFFSIKRGVATGDNSFFVLDATEAERLDLPRQFLHPILPNPRLVPSDVIEGAEDGGPLDLPRLVLLNCSLPRTAVRAQFPGLDRYLREGERQLVPRRYLTRSRNPWYRQEIRPPAPILCTYMARKKKSGKVFRFLRNYSRATAHNVYLLLYPRGELVAAAKADPTLIDRIFEYLGSVPAVELIGRVYGGGLNKLEPRELASLQLPADLAASIRDLARQSNYLDREGNLLLLATSQESERPPG